jgi:hypothetical protein
MLRLAFRADGTPLYSRTARFCGGASVLLTRILQGSPPSKETRLATREPDLQCVKNSAVKRAALHGAVGRSTRAKKAIQMVS